MFVSSYLYRQWRDHDDYNNAWCSVITWLASRVEGDDDFELTESECGMSLEYAMYWPKVFHNTVDAQRDWRYGKIGIVSSCDQVFPKIYLSCKIRLLGLSHKWLVYLYASDASLDSKSTLKSR